MKTKLPPVLEAKLVDFRRRVWVLKLTEGLFAAVFGIALSYLVVFVLDRFLETSAWLRLVLFDFRGDDFGAGVAIEMAFLGLASASAGRCCAAFTADFSAVG